MRIPKRFSLVCFLLFTLLIQQNLKAQATTQFMGKTYKVYPQIINSYYTTVSFDVDDLKFYNLDIPPIVGNYTDGEYLLYSKRFELKNRRVVNGVYAYDTIRNVFAIIPIKNNKKEGIVTVFDQDTKLPVYKIPYKNDMIDGHFVLYQNQSARRASRYSRHYEWRDDYYEYETNFEKGYSAVPVKANKIVLNYREGFIDGSLTVYACTKKDTVLIDSMTLEKGWLQGLKTEHRYQMYKKHITKVASTYTHYKDNTEVGQTIDYNFLDKTKTVSVHDDDADLIADYEYTEYNRLKKASLYPLDSIKKYYPNYKEIAVFPDVNPENEYDDGTLYQSEKLVMYFKDNKQTDFAIKYDDFVSINFSALERDIYRDTIMMGKFFRIKTYTSYDKITTTTYLIDTCSSKMGSKSCAKVYTRSFEFKKLSSANYTEKTNLYYQMNPNETVQNLAITTTVKKGRIAQKYYYTPLNYHYYNHTFTKGKYAGARSYYKVQGNQSNGTIIHFLKIPMKYDSLLLIDTIMNKGHYTYKFDKLFYDSYTKFLLTTERNSSWSSSDKYDYFDLLTSMLSYFELIPNQHKAIYVGRQAYTGKVELNWHYKRSPNNFKAKMYEIKQVWALKPTLVIELDVEARKYLLRANKSKLIAPTKRITINSSYGAFTGTYSMTDIFGHSSSYTHYYDNKINDDIEYSLYTSTKNKYNKAIQYKHLQRAESSMMNYDQGKKEGQWQLNTESNYSGGLTQLVFHNNQLNGTQYQFKNNSGYKYLSRVYEMKNDTINGAIWKLSRTGYPISKGFFKMGIPDGEFIRYNVSDFKVRDTAKYVSEVIPFKHGYLDGTYKLYRDTNNLKYTVQLSIKDSLFYSVFKSNSRSYDEEHYTENKRLVSYEEQNNKFFNGNDFMDNLPSRFRSGYYTYYYKSGFVFKKGKKSYSDPTGLWSFYREGQGRLFKTIDFKDSTVYLSTTDSISTVGLVKTYYDNGQLMFEGWAQNMDTKYTCESEADMPTEEDHYLSFYDENGKSLLENGSGVVTELQASGHKLKEGRLDHFKKQGVWVYYNNYGQAEAMGLYENGLKVGRWITGDLSGLHLSEKVCFMSNEEYFDWIAQYGGDLNFKEEFYNKGQLIQSNGVETIRR